LAWLLLIVGLGVVGMALGALQNNKTTKPVIDPEEYAYLMSYEVSDIYDLEQYFVLHQYGFLPIAPPEPGFSLLQSGIPEVLPFDEKNFPPEFLSALEGQYLNSVPVYGIVVYEDPISRETVFVTESGKEIYSIPPVPGYDPFAFVKDKYSWLYAEGASYDQRAFWQEVFDPARIQLVTKLIAVNNVEPYLYAQAQVAAAANPSSGSDRRFGGGGGIVPMGPSGPGTCTTFQFSAISKTPTGILVTICCPDVVTNVDIFTTTNLPPSWWRLDGTNLPAPGDSISWTITNEALAIGAGNPDIHSDIDGIPDDREFFLYHTSGTNIDSDGDGLSDGYSGVVGTNSYPGGAHTNGGQYVEGELSQGTDQLNADTDGDSVSDGTEITEGTSPLNGNDPPSVSGTITYATPGRQTGFIWVVAATTSNSWATNCSARLNEPGTYQIIKTCLTNYFLKVWRDTDGDSTNDTNEAFGIYTNNPIVVTGKLTNINLTLIDPDNDADSLPDWWEVRHFGSTTNWGATNDPDADEYSNLEEYLADYSPTNSSSHPHNIEGSISYGGPQTGTFVAVASTSDSWTVSGYDTLSTTGIYSITHLVTNLQYWVKAYRDSNGNTNNDYFEAWGASALNPILLTNNLTNINVTLTNPDTDGDSIPDYWEIQYGLDPSNGGNYGGSSYLSGWWKLDENSGTNVSDSSSYTNTGYLSATGLAPACWTRGAISNSLTLNGTNSYVQLYDSDSLKPQNVSVLAWIKPGQTYTSGSAIFYSKKNATNSTGYELSYTNGFLTFIVYATAHRAVSIPLTLSTGSWLHIAGTYNGEIESLYTNGTLAASTTWDNGQPPPAGGIPISQSTMNPRIGASPDATPTNYFMGRMDDIRVYPSALTSNDVRGAYQLGVDTDGDGLGYWDEYHWGADPTLTDSDSDGLPDPGDAYPGIFDTNQPAFIVTYPTNNMAIP